MGTHYLPGGIDPETGKRVLHPGQADFEQRYEKHEREWLRTENRRLTEDLLKARGEVKILRHEVNRLRNGMEKDLLVRRLRLDLAHSGIRNFTLMARLSSALADIKRIRGEVEEFITGSRMPNAPGSAAKLSKMLFGARENLEMWADVVEKRTDQPAASVRALVDEIDSFRAARGWSPNGFGGEE